MKAYGGMEVYLHPHAQHRCLIELGGGVSLTPRAGTVPEESAADIHSIEGWIDPRADLDALKRGKCLAADGNRNLSNTMLRRCSG
jgi:hypothetical protein